METDPRWAMGQGVGELWGKGEAENELSRNQWRQGQGKKQQNEESHRFTLDKPLFCLLMFS